jgi:glycosyltransferase involved in cell wall biosynthesis
MRLLRITTVPISLHLLLTGQLRYMVDRGFEVFTISADGHEVEEVLKEGVHHIPVPFTRKITVFHDLRCLVMLVRIIRKIKPDIIHTHTPKAGLLGMLAGWICRVPVRMHTVAGLPLMETSGLRRRVLNTTERITYACAQHVYPNSRGLAEFIAHDLGANGNKVKMIGKGSSNGIDTFYFSRGPGLEVEATALRIRYGITPDDVVFSFVGRIVKDKGIVELISAFKSLADELANKSAEGGVQARIFLMLVGPFEQNLDPLPADLVTFIDTDPRIIHAGFQDDVRPWIMASDIFVFPSYREGFPNVVMQACLLEVPCIVSDINGCNEIITNGVTGLIVPPKDVDALVHAMRFLMMDAPQRLTYASAARDFVAINFDRRLVWRELYGEYERLLVRRK